MLSMIRAELVVAQPECAGGVCVDGVVPGLRLRREQLDAGFPSQSLSEDSVEPEEHIEYGGPAGESRPEPQTNGSNQDHGSGDPEEGVPAEQSSGGGGAMGALGALGALGGLLGKGKTAEKIREAESRDERRTTHNPYSPTGSLPAPRRLAPKTRQSSELQRGDDFRF